MVRTILRFTLSILSLYNFSAMKFWQRACHILQLTQKSKNKKAMITRNVTTCQLCFITSHLPPVQCMKRFAFPFCSWMSSIHELRRHSGVSRWRSLTHSLTHSILTNLFIKSGLNHFFPTSPAKYCFCPKVFSRFSTRRV